jgi:hypothetical protein
MSTQSNYRIEAESLPIKEFCFSVFTFIICCAVAKFTAFYPLVFIGMGLGLAQFSLEIIVRVFRDGKRVTWNLPKAWILALRAFLLWLPFLLTIGSIFVAALWVERQIEKGIVWLEKKTSKSIDSTYYAVDAKISLEQKELSEKGFFDFSKFWNRGKIKLLRVSQRGLVESKTKLVGYGFTILHWIMDIGGYLLLVSFLYLVVKTYFFVLAKSVLWRESSSPDGAIIFRLP